MPKETYQIKSPQHIMFGDPLYFERFTGDDLQRFTVDYKTAKSFNAARLVLQEQPNKMSPEFIDRTMTLYLAPHQTVDVYADDKMFAAQQVEEKPLCVDTARYLLNVDGRSNVIRTGADGWWGSFQELYRQNGNSRISDAVILTIFMPEDYGFDRMKQLAGYFFEDMQPVVPPKRKEKDSPAR